MRHVSISPRERELGVTSINNSLSHKRLGKRQQIRMVISVWKSIVSSGDNEKSFSNHTVCSLKITKVFFSKLHFIVCFYAHKSSLWNYYSKKWHIRLQSVMNFSARDRNIAHSLSRSKYRVRMKDERKREIGDERKIIVAVLVSYERGNIVTLEIWRYFLSRDGQINNSLEFFSYRKRFFVTAGRKFSTPRCQKLLLRSTEDNEELIFNLLNFIFQMYDVIVYKTSCDCRSDNE